MDSDNGHLSLEVARPAPPITQPLAPPLRPATPMADLGVRPRLRAGADLAGADVAGAEATRLARVQPRPHPHRPAQGAIAGALGLSPAHPVAGPVALPLHQGRRAPALMRSCALAALMRASGLAVLAILITLDEVISRARRDR